MKSHRLAPRMLKYVFSVLLAVVMLVPQAVLPMAVSAEPTTPYSRTITVNSGQVPSTLTDFPALVSITFDSLKNVGNGGHVANSDGSDIYFTDYETGTAQYPFEIEKYDPITGALVAWVKVPSLSDGTVIVMKYGGSAAVNTPSDVWSNSFQGVWHMGQVNPSDSTSNGNNGTAQGIGTLTQASGIIGGSISFPGNDSPAYISCGNAASLGFTATSSYTWSTWVNPAVSGVSGGLGVLEKKTAGTDVTGQGYAIGLGGTPTIRFQTTSDGTYQLQSSATAGIGMWTLITVTYNNGNASVYVNGSLDASKSIPSSDDTANNFLIGRRSAETTKGYFNGAIDEVEYASGVRSADWILTQYRNQSNPGAFFIIGAEEGGSTGEASPEITSQPSDQTVTEGQDANFTASASGNPVPSVQWKVSTDSGATWSIVDGADNTTLTLTAVTLGQNHYQFHAVFTNTEGTVTSNAATLTVNRSPAAPAVVTQPLSQTVTAGGTAIFAAVASGYPISKIQWQVSSDGGSTWHKLELDTNPALYLYSVSSSQNSNQYRAIYTNSQGTATTDVVTLTVNAAAPADTTPPQWLAQDYSNSLDTTTTPYTLHLSWGGASDDIGVTQYRIYMGNSVIATVAATQLDYVMPTIATDSNYWFKIQAGDAAGNWSTSFNFMGGSSQGPVVTQGYQVYDGIAGGPATAPQWNAEDTEGWLRAYNAGTAAKPDTLFRWSKPVGGDYDGLTWGYIVLSDYVTTPQMHIDSVNIGDQDQYHDYANRAYYWTTDDWHLHTAGGGGTGYGSFVPWPEASKDYYFSMMARNWADSLHVRSPEVHFNTAWAPMMYAYQYQNDPNGNHTYMTYPECKVSYVQASGSNNKQTVYNVITNPVDPQNAWFEILRTGGTNPGWTIAAGAVDTRWVLTDKETGEVIPLTPNLTSVTVQGNYNPWNSSYGTFYGYSSGSLRIWQVHVTYSGDYTSTTTLLPNHTYVLSLNGPWPAVYIPDNYTYSWEFTTASVDKVPPTWPAVAELIATSITPTTVSLSWTPAVDNLGVTGYKVYRDGALAATVPGTPTTYTDTGLTPGTSHTYYVIAQDYLLNLSTQLALAGSVTTPVDTSAPTWPAGPTLMAQNIQGTSIDLVWVAALDTFPVTGYRINQGDQLIATVAGNILTYHVTGLEPGGSYSFTVQAGDESNNWSTDGPTISIGSGLDTLAPTWPNGSAITITSVNATSIAFSWPAATDNHYIDHYDIFVNGSLTATNDTATLTFILNDLTPDTGYDIQVSGVDPAGNASAGTLINQRTTPALDAAFTADITSGTAPVTVHFTDQSTEFPTSWSWDFDNNGVVDSSDQNPTYIYTTPGIYTVKLTATNILGSNDEIKTNYITILAPVAPVAGFIADITISRAPFTVQFTDKSTDAPTSWSWDFDNNGTPDSADQNPSYSYTTPGIYTVKLTTTNDIGSDDEVKTDYITVLAPAAPAADFTASTVNGTAPLTVSFFDRSTNIPTSWEWDFNNDGATDSADQNPSYIYTVPGTYTVKLTATNAAGSDDEMKTDYITVLSTVTPEAKFTVSSTGGTAPLSVVFTDKSTNAPTSWSWDFDNDGTPDSTAQNPSYIYTANATYTVSLTVSNDAGSNTKIKTDFITVRQPWYVDAAGSGDFTTIQAAIDAAGTGDTIIVKNGSYQENVTVNKSVTLRAENPLGATVNVKDISTSIFTITATNVVIDGFTITGVSTFSWCGIDARGGSYCTLTNNRINAVNTGIVMANYNTVSNNHITSNGYGNLYGYVIYDMGCGILLYNGSHHNTITNNYCTSSNGISIGILIFTVSGCTIGDGHTQITTEYNIISYNTCDSNQHGIRIQQSSRNTLFGNTISNNQYGLSFRQNGDATITPANVFYLNTITGSTIANINYYDSYGNAGNIWNSPSPLTYTYSGNSYTGYVGNYWSDYSGNDADGNGIGDTPYLTQPFAGEYDNYPMIATGSAYPAAEIPEASFTSTVIIGTAPLTVTFTNTTMNTQSMTYAWDFNNDGTIDNTQRDASYTYTEAGDYTVSLTVTNAAGNDTEIKINYIHVKAAEAPWYVAPSGADFTSIQAAIEMAYSGETVIVRDGTYLENPSVTKDLTIQSENLHGAIVNGSFTLLCDGVTIDGFTVSGDIICGRGYYNATYGFYIISNNLLSNGMINGQNMGNSIITNNNCKGLIIHRSSNWDNTTNNLISGNIFHDANYGIYLDGFSGFDVESNTFTNNILLNNRCGIYLDHASKNIFYQNSFLGNTVADVSLYANGSAGNTWSSPDNITYWYNGTQFTGYAGNYWSRYTGTDADANGIGDTAYTITGTDTDNYPLMFPVSGYSETPASSAADFTSDLQVGTAGFTVQFLNLSTGSAPMTYAWDFGDGGISALPNPTHAYNTQGIYTVILTVTNSAGSVTATKTDYISVAQPILPEAAFTTDITSGTAPLTVNFTDLTETGTPPLSYAWDFNNDSVIDSTDRNPSFTYSTPGTYTVKFTVTNAAGSDDEIKTDYMTVTAPEAPVAAFAANVVSGTAPLTVYFTDQTVTGTPPLTYAWDFNGDNVTDSTDRNPSFTYTAAGTYTVKVTVTNTVGSDDEVKADYITVTAPVTPVAAFTADVTNGSAPLTVHFTDQSANFPTSWSWDFNNDGTEDSNQQNPSHTYAVGGTYSVKLTVSNAAGSNFIVKTGFITVTSVVPVADFTADTTSGIVPFTVHFTDQSTNNPTSWFWDFNNDGILDSTQQNPSHTYTLPGNYTVKLTASNAVGSDTEIKVSYITGSLPIAPVAAFSVSTVRGPSPLTVNFLDRTVTGSPPLIYAWDFNNDGVVDSSEQNPSYTYTAPVKYTVSFTVTNIAGSSTLTMTDYIDVRPAGAWYVDDDGGADFTTIQAAINAAAAGETIVVRDGNYPENVTINKRVTLVSDIPHGSIINPASGNIFTVSANGVTIDGFTLSQNSTSTAWGIYVSSDYYTGTFKNNDINNIGSGIGIMYNATGYHGSNTITNNTITFSQNGAYGIYLRLASYNIITGNVIRDPYNSVSTYGIYLGRSISGESNSTNQCSGNTISLNTVEGTAFGIFLYFRPNTNNVFLNNFIGITNANVGQNSPWNWFTLTWNSSPNQITYIYNGVQYTGIMGNYWGSYYTGTDADDNGIGDTQYLVPNSDKSQSKYYNYDAYPLMFANPTAEFTSDIQSGIAPLTVNFTDNSSGIAPLAYAWDFDNDGNIDSTQQNPSYTYNNPGIFTVKLTITSSGINSEISRTGYITVQPAQAGGGAGVEGGTGGGGGGGGGSGSSSGGKTVTGLRGSSSSIGVVWANIRAQSADTKTTLDIPYGTKCTNANGNALTSITITQIDNPDAAQTGATIVGTVYDFSPKGASFDPPITLTIKYNEADVPAGMQESGLTITIWDAESGTYQAIDCEVDTEANTITASISHFSRYTIIAVPVVTPTPKPTPAPTQTTKPASTPTAVPATAASPTTTPTPMPTATQTPTTPAVSTPATTTPVAALPIEKTGTNWPLIGGIIGGVIVIGLLAFIFIRRRQLAE